MGGSAVPPAPLASVASPPADPFAAALQAPPAAAQAAAPLAPATTSGPAAPGAGGMAAAGSGNLAPAGSAPGQKAPLSNADIMALFSKPAEAQFGQPALQPRFGQPAQVPPPHARSANFTTGPVSNGRPAGQALPVPHPGMHAAASAPQLHPQAGMRQGQGAFPPQPHPQHGPYSKAQQQHAQHLQAAGADGHDLFASLAPQGQHAPMRAGSGSMAGGGMVMGAGMGAGMGMAAQQAAPRTVPVLQQPAPPVVPVAPVQQGFADFGAFST